MGRFGACQLTKWARLLKRVFDIDIQHCPKCGGGELKIIAVIPKRPVIQKILDHLGLDLRRPPEGRAREAGHGFAAWAVPAAPDIRSLQCDVRLNRLIALNVACASL